MAFKGFTNSPHLILFLPILLILLCRCGVVAANDNASDIDSSIGRSGFPEGFIFGAASSAYQVEGGAAEGGRKQSIWDNFTHKYPEKIKGRSNGDVAVNSYHLYKEDVQHLKDMNMDAYRFSISWSRILPSGSLEGGINKEGIKYYNDLIDSLVSQGLKPFVTLFHFDVPQGLEDAYGGFLSRKIVVDFRDYVDVCFQAFGDRVKHWITLNEPYTFSTLAYATGIHAPGRCSPSVNPNCTGGDSGTEPYIVGHNMLLAHAAAVKLYREKYKESQKGSIGITVVSSWFLPLSNSKPYDDAITRALDFSYGWFMDPLTNGDYPFIMKALVGKRLPAFTVEQSKMIKGSYDFIGLNYYTSDYVSSLPLHNQVNATYMSDSFTNTTGFRNGRPIGPEGASEWLFVYPPGIKDLLLYTKNKYNNPIIYITENGFDEFNNKTLPLKEALKDNMRIEYVRKHLQYVKQAIREGARVKGYFAWSLLDNFEWADGFTFRFGLYFVDYNDGLKRYPKKSAIWMGKLLRK